MCNACGNCCCGSDEFDRCGCDGCPEPDCWDDADEGDDFDFGDEISGFDEDDGGLPMAACGCRVPSRFQCEAL